MGHNNWWGIGPVLDFLLNDQGRWLKAVGRQGADATVLRHYALAVESEFDRLSQMFRTRAATHEWLAEYEAFTQQALDDYLNRS